MNISKTESPSRKFEITGNSMVFPLGAAIKPRIPDNCVKLEMLPRAPESLIIWIGLDGSMFSTNFIWMSSLALFQIAMTRL